MRLFRNVCSMFRPTQVILFAFIALAALWLIRCMPSGAVEMPAYLNLNDTVQYVGMETCRSCHGNVHDTYIHTGMGASFRSASPTNTKALFGEHALVYDSASHYYYFPFFVDSTLYIREFRLDGQDTIHNRVEKISYIIGSGHHTHSHILNRNGYLYQAPITFYTQEKRWDMAPGFEGGNNSRFSRILTTECITCHNHFPKHVKGSENKYTMMPEGIACERCHGPGQLHVAAMLEGNIVDTSKQADLTIVNPRRLPRDRQTDLCQRCHLQGVTVLQPGKTFYDFRPGMELSDVMNVFLPRYSDNDERFIMASQADRLRLSKCYLSSEELTCITCHHPHISVAQTKKGIYNAACQKCHTKSTCTAPKAERDAQGNNCSGCHMPASSSIDIPHVSITDHYIRKSYKTATLNKEKGKFLGLACLTKIRVTPLELAEGYLALYDKFIHDPIMLDSAESYLKASKEKESRLFPVRVHLHFNREDYGVMAQWAEKQDTSGLDGWTAYRLGEACMRTMRHRQGVKMLQRAVSAAPFNLEFLEKYGVALGMNHKNEEAERIFRRILLEDPSRPLSLTNLGYLRALQGDTINARAFYNRALALDPDFEQAKANSRALEDALSKRADRR